MKEEIERGIRAAYYGPQSPNDYVKEGGFLDQIMKRKAKEDEDKTRLHKFIAALAEQQA